MTNFIKQIIIWKTHREMLYPEDILNMLIEHGLTSEYVVCKMLNESDKDVEFKLPKKYI